MISSVRNQNCLPGWLHNFVFPPALIEHFSCSTSLPAFCPGFGWSNRCVVVSHCYNLHFPCGIWSGPSFHMLICNLHILSVRVLSSFFVLFFYSWILLMLRVFCVTVLYQIRLLQIFFPSPFSFILTTLSFAQFSILMKSYLSIISFMDWTFGVVSKKS